MILLLSVIASCTRGPEQIHYGSEECAYCRMIISEPQYGSQLVTKHGLVYKFDSIECLAAYEMTGDVQDDHVHSLWVPDFPSGPVWVPASEAHYLHSETLRSPMGLSLSAYAEHDEAVLNQQQYRGTVIGWDEVKEIVKQEWRLMLTAIATEAPAATGSGELVVRPGGPVASIAEAIEMAEAGTTIRIMAGTYHERELVIDKKLTMIGEGNPVIDAQNEGFILKVLADSVQIRGMEFRNTGISYTRDHAALLVEEANGVIIDGNMFTNNFFAVYLATVRGAKVTNNHITASGTREASSGNGIHMWSTWNIEVTGNTINGHRDGIYLEFAKGALIRENTSSGNLRYGLHFMFSDDSHYHGNTFSDNGAGVAVMYSKNVQMTGNRFTENWGPAAYGLLLKDISDSEISGNLFRDNTIAIHSEGSNKIEVNNNRIIRNGWGVKVMANSQNNVFSSNNFIENTFDVATNSRQNYNRFEGNFWSRYDGYDLDRSGIGDVPHRPVRLYSLIVEQNPASLILIRGFFIDLLDLAERIMPTLTPETLIDEKPLMKEVNL